MKCRPIPCLLSAALLILCGTGAPAYVRFQTSDGSPYYRTDYAGITIRVNQAVAPGMTNSKGEIIITSDSDPLAALQAALTTWSNVPGSAVRFAPLSMSVTLKYMSQYGEAAAGLLNMPPEAIPLIVKI